MDKLNIRTADVAYVHALRQLIRTGVIAAPDLESSPLIGLPIVLRQVGNDASAAKRAYAFIKILQQVIRYRLEGKDAETANILFAFEGYAGVPIQDRYRAVAKLYNPYWTWENYRKEPLTRHLLAVYLALKREGELGQPLQFLDAQPRKGRTGLVGQDWVLEQFDGLYTLPTAEGEPLEAVQTRRLRAVCDQIDTYRHYAYVRERGISAVPREVLVGPGTLAVTDTYVEPSTNLRVYITEVTFPKPIRYGESIEFTLLRKLDAKLDQVIQDKGWDWYGLVTLASPAESARISVHFQDGKQPKHVWRYEDIISGMLRPGVPTPDNRIVPDASGFARHTWTDLSAGYSYGISMEW